MTIDTLFFGGGTPTHLSAEQLQRLMVLVLRRFRLGDGYEFSVEANPAGLDDARIDVLADAGVNRVSLGFNRSTRRYSDYWNATIAAAIFTQRYSGSAGESKTSPSI